MLPTLFMIDERNPPVTTRSPTLSGIWPTLPKAIRKKDDVQVDTISISRPKSFDEPPSTTLPPPPTARRSLTLTHTASHILDNQRQTRYTRKYT